MQHYAVYDTTFSWKVGGSGVKIDGWRIYLPDHQCYALNAAENHGSCAFKYYFSKSKKQHEFQFTYVDVMCDAVLRSTSAKGSGFPSTASGTMRCNPGSGVTGSGSWTTTLVSEGG